MEYLHGGRAQIARSGNGVHRPAGPWSNSVHLLLQHVRKHGFTGAPEPLGFDDTGNEVLTFLPGEVSNYPLSDAASGQSALESAARLLRAYHDASASFLNSETKQFPWMLPVIEPTEVMCHGDYAPYNVVLNGGKVTGIIDFDTAHPGSRVWDIAYALYRWAPLKNPTNPDSLGDLDDQIDRAKDFCDAYGLPRHDRQEIIVVAILRLKTLVDFMHNEAAKGNATFAAHLADGHHLGYLNDIAYLQENQTQIVHGLLQAENNNTGDKMKVLIIGGNGTIGNKVSTHFAKKHEVIIAGRTSGDVTVDIADSSSIEAMFEAVGKVDAVVCIAGEAKWAAFDTLTEEDYYIGLRSKLMGQVNLVRIGQAYVNPGGSFTLTTGILADHPVMFTTSAAMVNGGIHSFARAVSLELENGIRINVVSSGLVEDAIDKYEAYFPGHNPIPMNKVVNGYVKSVEGKGTGEIIIMYDNS